MSKGKPWRFSETRPIKPFRVAEDALNQCGFKTRDDAPFLMDDPWHLTMEPEEITSETFRPKLKIAIDQAKLCTDTGLAVDELQVTLVARDPGVWSSEKIAGWNLVDVPSEFELPESVKKTLSGARGLEFSLQVSPRTKLVKKFRTASSPSHIVASRHFVIAIPSDGSDFPIDLVDPAVFEEHGLPRETVWVVHWHTEADFDQPAEDVLVVLLNKDRAEKLLRLSATDSVASVLWAEIAVEVFVEVAAVVFRSDPSPPQNKDGLLSKIFKRLQSDTHLSFDEVVTKSKDPVRGTAFLRAHLQMGLELGDKISRMNLSGR